VSACLAVVAIGALGACSSQPSKRGVVSDTIQSLQLPDDQEDCMLERLDGYTDDQLDAIADENENWDPAGAGSTLQDASPSMRVFIADFEECTGVVAAEEPTGTSQVGGSTEPSGSTERSETSVSSESPEPSASTTPSETTAA